MGCVSGMIGVRVGDMAERWLDASGMIAECRFSSCYYALGERGWGETLHRRRCV